MLTLNEELKDYFSENPDGFKKIMGLHGEVYRALEGRLTQRILLNKKAYFIKQHNGVGWKEIFKNILQWRLPVISAKNEWHALKRLTALNVLVPTIVGYGCSGWNPAKKKSFLITHELSNNRSLEDFCSMWPAQPLRFHLKRKLILEVAKMARTLHKNGINHRDFYICHILLDLKAYENGHVQLYLIDLHRAQIRRKTPTRWLIKDLAGLYFSSKEIGLTKRDLLRFIKEYCNKSLSEVFGNELNFWLKIKKRGDQLYGKHKN